MFLEIMRVRKRMALTGAILIFLGCLIIYRMADYTLYSQDESSGQFRSNPSVSRTNIKAVIAKEGFVGIKKVFSSSSIQLKEAEPKICKRPTNDIIADVHMSDVYRDIKFDNIDGGVWKQGWVIETDPSRWNSQNKLKVFVVPHSHNDPGWLKTFEDYYTSETRNILSNMLRKMTTDPNKKFIWAEISYFSLWWDELSEEDQDKVRRLIQNGQLEIVTGGWVMNDEANTHYYSMITQLTEGHQWMKTNIGVQPKHGWTIDPFGESPVMPYLLKKMGLEGLIIQRVHYSVKKYFAKTKNLEFRWRQFWDEGGSTDLLTHMTPFYSYDVPHTCGPDPKICCQFDFKRLPGSGVSCPWKEPPKVITKKNVAVRAQMLLDQYRKKSELYRTNVILVPLGDDFRYQYSAEWDNQFENYYKIMSYINTNPQLHAEVKFGTLADFFKALTTELSPDNFPSLTGDFFTYADRDDHYWSGYYTSRPFYKKMDRILMGYHRAAEILFVLGWSVQNQANAKWLLTPQTGFAKMLRESRRSVSLFQHHDGITGTARDHVMVDYARKMIDAIKYSQHIIQQVSHFLLSSPDQPYLFDSEQVYFGFDDQRKYFNALPDSPVIILGEGEIKTVVFFNPLTHKRTELASVMVFTPYVEIQNSDGVSIPCQTSPHFSQDAVMDESQFEVSFVVHVPALGLASYKVTLKNPNKSYRTNTFSKVKLFNYHGPVKPSNGFNDFKQGDPGEFSVENEFVSVALSENGFLKSITNKETAELMPVHLDFVRYSARPGQERSGAYLFLPACEATILKVVSPLIKVLEGPIFTRVQVSLPNVKHYLTLYNAPALQNLGIDVVNVVDILYEKNYELAMRITSHVKSGSDFYTDLNGFQMIKRKRLGKLPIQGNFYPMPSASYIEDQKTRITILSGQPLGVSSLKNGELEVLQDRRLDQDDNRGLGQGVLDNKVTPNAFRILLERRLENCNVVPSLLSSNAHASSQSLLYPMVKMIWKRETQNDLRSSYSPVGKDLGSDMHLLTVRTFDEEVTPSAGFVLHRTHLDNCFVKSANPSDGVVNWDSFLPNRFGEEVTKTSLSFLNEKKKVLKREDQLLCHMDFLAVVLS